MGSAESILKVFEIIKNRLKNEKAVVVVSAMGGVTDEIIKQANIAAKGDDSYINGLSELKNKHIETVSKILPIPAQNQVFEYINEIFEKLEKQLKGVSLLKELSKSSLDKVVCQGEYLSAYILWALFQVKQVKTKLVDSAKIIKADIEDNSVIVYYKSS